MSEKSKRDIFLSRGETDGSALITIVPPIPLEDAVRVRLKIGKLTKTFWSLFGNESEVRISQAEHRGGDEGLLKVGEYLGGLLSEMGIQSQITQLDRMPDRATGLSEMANLQI